MLGKNYVICLKEILPYLLKLVYLSAYMQKNAYD
jgi:hypothetical protein